MAYLTIYTLLLTLPLVYFTHSVVNLYQNYKVAKRTNLPILINPVWNLSPLWLLTRDYLNPLIRLLPAPLSAWTDRVDIGWNQQPKWRTHAELGSPAFWIVTPGSRDLYIADPAAAEEVLRRSRTDFIKNPAMYGVLNMFGDTVNSVNGKTWERHRRITVPPFNEGVSGAVWDESGRQVKSARQAWLKTSEGDGTFPVVRTTQRDCTRIALHVLTGAGLGLRYDFLDNELHDSLPAGHCMSYRDSIHIIVKDIGIAILVSFLQKVRWPEFVTWGRVKEMYVAAREFLAYIKELLEDERRRMRAGERHRENLMSVLVRSADRTKSSGETGTNTGLSDEDVYGNMFMYNLAGHDTTANTMTFAIVQLAIEPRWQEWIAEEIDTVLGDKDWTNPESWKYEDIFPKLPRCLALMYETVRVNGPTPSVPRWTGASWQTLVIDGKPITLPPNTDITVSFTSLHTRPDAWGDDAYAFRPDRWIVDNPESSTSTHTQNVVDEEHPYDWQSSALLQPRPGTFVPWNVGPRVCPGKKFSQVEFVRVVAGLFCGGNRVRLVPEEGESLEAARARAARLVDDARVDFTLKMVNSETIGLQWYQVGK